METQLERYERCLKEYTTKIKMLKLHLYYNIKANASKRRQLKRLRYRFEQERDLAKAGKGRSYYGRSNIQDKP